eukprot:Hpha_TRINITY_DN15285_c0_g1::TRINITY_DN15285_c0_g1_i1::g.65164::m.65164
MGGDCSKPKPKAALAKRIRVVSQGGEKEVVVEVREGETEEVVLTRVQKLTNIPPPALLFKPLSAAPACADAAQGPVPAVYASVEQDARYVLSQIETSNSWGSSGNEFLTSFDWRADGEVKVVSVD